MNRELAMGGLRASRGRRGRRARGLVFVLVPVLVLVYSLCSTKTPTKQPTVDKSNTLAECGKMRGQE